MPPSLSLPAVSRLDMGAACTVNYPTVTSAPNPSSVPPQDPMGHSAEQLPNRLQRPPTVPTTTLASSRLSPAATPPQQPIRDPLADPSCTPLGGPNVRPWPTPYSSFEAVPVPSYETVRHSPPETLGQTRGQTPLQKPSTDPTAVFSADPQANPSPDSSVDQDPEPTASQVLKRPPADPPTQPCSARALGPDLNGNRAAHQQRSELPGAFCTPCPPGPTSAITPPSSAAEGLWLGHNTDPSVTPAIIELSYSAETSAVHGGSAAVESAGTRSEVFGLPEAPETPQADPTDTPSETGRLLPSGDSLGKLAQLCIGQAQRLQKQNSLPVVDELEDDVAEIRPGERMLFVGVELQ